jgi:maleate isomerase
MQSETAPDQRTDKSARQNNFGWPRLFLSYCANFSEENLLLESAGRACVLARGYCQLALSFDDMGQQMLTRLNISRLFGNGPSLRYEDQLPFDACPSSNTTIEADFMRILPTGVTVHTARMFLAETTAEAERFTTTFRLRRPTSPRCDRTSFLLPVPAVAPCWALRARPN